MPQTMKKITDIAIEQAKNTDLISLVEQITGRQGKRLGNDIIFYNCPFHSPDKTPSFAVYSNNTYHCFGCGVHGDSISFVMEQLNLSFTEAVLYLNGELEDRPVEYKKVEIIKESKPKESANSELLSSFLGELINELTENDFTRVETYLNTRKLSLVDFGWDKEGNIFNISREEPILVPLPKGSEARNSFAIYNHIKKELLASGFTEDIMIEHGIFGEKGSVYAFFDFVFVYYGESINSNTVITNLQARKIKAEKGEMRECFIKNKTVLPFNMNILSRLPYKSTIYLTEAPIDAVSLTKLLSNPRYNYSSTRKPFVVSTGGSQIKPDRLIALAKQKSMTVKLAMDNDKAGEIATTYWLDKFQQNGIVASKFTGIPDNYKDANDYLIAVYGTIF